MEKPVQYLLVGFPYSGKSTLAGELQSRLGFAHINIDQLKVDKGFGGVGDDDVPDRTWDEIFSDADVLIHKYLTEGKNVANEYAWITRGWRDRARKVARNAGFATKVIYLKVPLDVIRQRWLENDRTRTRFQWSEGELASYLRDFEEPTSDEDIIVYDQSLSVHEWINQNFLRQ